MSHTTEIHGTVFIHDGDFFGDVIIKHHNHGEPPFEVSIPFATLREFVVEHVRQEKIREFENMHPDKLLGNGVFST